MSIDSARYGVPPKHRDALDLDQHAGRANPVTVIWAQPVLASALRANQPYVRDRLRTVREFPMAVRVLVRLMGACRAGWKFDFDHKPRLKCGQLECGVVLFGDSRYEIEA
jgi:hypothetical protein